MARAKEAEAQALAAAAEGRSRERLETHLHWRQRLQGVFGIGLPPLIGMGILVAVLTPLGQPDVEWSGGATSAALFVAALLILVPAILFAFSPDHYAKYETRQHKDLNRILGHTDDGSQ